MHGDGNGKYIAGQCFVAWREEERKVEKKRGERERERERLSMVYYPYSIQSVRSVV